MNILGNSINSAVENTRSILAATGRAALHALAPDLIEYYLCSLELLDSSGNTKGFMTFPVMPTNMSETKTQIATISKTNTGVVSVFNSTFCPVDISIQGTFGRKFRLMIGATEPPTDVSVSSYFGDEWNGSVGRVAGQNVLIKTGYGLVKMLKNMCAQSWKLDDKGEPCILVFTNYALNTSYIVEVLQDSYQQNIENNMLWFYSLEMRGVAPGSAVKGNQSANLTKFITTVAAGAIAKSIGNIVNDSERILNLGL